MKLRLIGYELILQKVNTFHYTHFPEKEYIEDNKPYQYDFNIDKRINAMVKEHGFIEYIFRDFDVALMGYGEYAVQLLKDVMVSLINIRNRLLSAGATQEHMKLYDIKIHQQFHRLLGILENRSDFEVLEQIKDFDIKEYYAADLSESHP